jgi:hypothetical protein
MVNVGCGGPQKWGKDPKILKLCNCVARDRVHVGSCIFLAEKMKSVACPSAVPTVLEVRVVIAWCVVT